MLHTGLHGTDHINPTSSHSAFLSGEFVVPIYFREDSPATLKVGFSEQIAAEAREEANRTRRQRPQTAPNQRNNWVGGSPQPPNSARPSTARSRGGRASFVRSRPSVTARPTADTSGIQAWLTIPKVGCARSLS